jgi:uncharacterized protein (DUF983 family)
MIFAHTCLNCGHTWTPGLVQVAQVVKVNCYECGEHIRYCSPDDLPDLEVIKQAIFEASGADLEVIEAAKRGMMWTPSMHLHFAQVRYLRLYNAVFFVKKIKKDLARITPRITFV